MEAGKLTSFEQIYDGNHDIYVACPRVFFAQSAHKATMQFLEEKGLFRSATKESILLTNGIRIAFMLDRPENFRGRTGYLYSTLDNYERVLEEELKKG